MSYYFNRIVHGQFDDVKKRVIEELAAEGFGIISEIDVRQTMKKKLDVDFRPYLILGACNPGFAHKALQAEDKIGTMLPCNVILQGIGEDRVEVAAVDPIASMAAVRNEALVEIAGEVRSRLARVVERL